MASRCCLLLALCSTFAAAWSNDQGHQERALTARQSRQPLSARLALRTDLPPGEGAFVAAGHRYADEAALQSAGVVPMPADLPSGEYRIVGSNGSVRTISLGGWSKLGTASARRHDRSGTRYEFIRVHPNRIQQATSIDAVRH